ncbi:hypothetical protein C6A37_05590 [Desulfobacteraceae bacterium SEEP-SAG9]|nr:hypothetical protein C6A37_05590 [Desulfobacteraceae bacterium SEEP-SAG9]
MVKKVVFLYPGQGAQQVGMGSDLYQTYPLARQCFEKADHQLGLSLTRLCFEGPGEDLDKDLHAQLTVYTVSCILTDVLRNYGIFPDAVAGYSSGFYAAAYAAGCFDFSYGLNLVKRAGEILLDEGLKINGSMAVVFGLSHQKIAQICGQVEKVEVAILNTPRQIIISGIDSAVKRVMAISLAAGALDAYPLSAETAYHCGLMKKSGLRLLREIESKQLENPQTPLMSYRSLKWVADKRDLKKVMAAQLSGPVRWVDLIKRLCDMHNGLVFEVGPGQVISRTVRWIDRNIKIIDTATNTKVMDAVEKYHKI